MRHADSYRNLAGSPAPYGIPPNGNPNFSSATSSNQIRPQLPYNSALFFNTMVAAAANSLTLPNMMGHSAPNAAAYNAAYQNAAYSQYYYQQQCANANLQRQNSAFQPANNGGVPRYQPNPAKVTKEATATPSRKTKKRPPSEPPEKSDLRRREDFNKLARARTDVLLKDKSLFTPLTVNDTMANGSSTSSCNSLNSDQMSASNALALKNRELINALLDEKVRQLLMSPSILESLRAKQAAINNKMREEETFVAKMRKADSATAMR